MLQDGHDTIHVAKSRIERYKLQLKKLPLHHNAVGEETGTNPQMLIAMKSSPLTAAVA